MSDVQPKAIMLGNGGGGKVSPAKSNPPRIPGKS
jgi:hypothetical protein